MDKPETVKILEVRDEAKGIKTIKLDKGLDARAGQFVMLWIPEVGEKPFSLSKVGKGVEITFDVKGKFTEKLAEMKRGDLVGVRGPYGNGWDLKGKRNVCIVAGGLGLAPVMPVIETMKCSVIYGVKNKDYIKFKKRLEKSGNKVIHTTDDGSFGEKCYACDLLDGVLAEGGYDVVLTCGPEILMKRVIDICLKNKIECQASLERWMKCGIGVCGSCVIDPSGMRVCKDGPVFKAEQLADTEFGGYRRDKSGAKHQF
jgi:dihydroorotate dehydrogenase electron transfer subunit